MQLNLFTDIALKSLMYLKPAKGLVTINEMAEQFSIPKNHLTKVLNKLVRLNWINSVRGRSGGLRYNLATDEIKLGEAIAILEAKSELLNCDLCILNTNCTLRNILKESVDLFYASLNKYNIADLVNGKTGSFINIMHQDFDSIPKYSSA